MLVVVQTNKGGNAGASKMDSLHFKGRLKELHKKYWLSTFLRTQINHGFLNGELDAHCWKLF